jgi:hypothetical protein
MYERDGEVRVDPLDGEAFVLRAVLKRNDGSYAVWVNDLAGQKTATLSIEEWLAWKKQDA